MSFEYFDEKDTALYNMLKHVSLLDGPDPANLPRAKSETTEVYYPDGEYGFTHEAAIIAYHGTLFASWYNCPTNELKGRTPIRGRRSRDGGKTWGEIEVLADDPTGKLLYCPPVYGVCDDRLYLLMNEMVAPDHIHALDLFIYNEEKDVFELLWSKPIPFKLNTNVERFPDGRLILPGRIAKLDGFPNTPAVLISDSGKIDAVWRLVKLQETGALPDGSKLCHPELSAIIDGGRVLIFSRDDERKVPLIYLSEDNGESWRGPIAHDIPFSNSKIYSGRLKNGGSYVIGNLWPGRSKLAIFFAEPGSAKFTRGYILEDGVSEKLGYGSMWHYPVACEADGKLYVICTVNVSEKGRGAAVIALDLE